MSWKEAEDCDRLFRFDRRMRSIRYHLRAIEQDIRLSLSGWRVNYAIDYCELYRYAFPLHSLLKEDGDRLSQRSSRREMVEKTAATCLLLRGCGLGERLVLLPAYAAELSDFLSRMTPQQSTLESQINSIRRSGSHLSDADSAVLSELANWRGAVNDMPEPLKNRSLQLIVQHCKELLFLLFSVVRPGVASIRDMLEGTPPKLRTVGDLVHNEESWLNIDEVFSGVTLDTTVSGQWFAMLQGTRNRFTSDLIDAAAIESIFSLNKSLTAKREVVLLVSDAPTMTRALNWDLVDVEPPSVTPRPRGIVHDVSPEIDPFQSEYRMLRTPRTFMFYLMCVGNSPQETLERVQARRKEVDHYFAIAAQIVRSVKGLNRSLSAGEEIRTEGLTRCVFYDRRTGYLNEPEESQCRQCGFYNTRKKLAHVLECHERVVRQFENASIYSNMEKFLGGLIRPRHELLDRAYGETLSNAAQKFLSLVKGESVPFAEEMNSECDKLVMEIDKTRESITSTVIRDVTSQTIDDLRYRLDQYIRVFGRVGFRDSRVTDAIKNVQRSLIHKTSCAKDIGIYLFNLHNLSKRPATSVPEAPLLQATLAFIHGQYDFCIEQCAHVLSSHGHRNPLGAKYLKCLATHEQACILSDLSMAMSALEEARIIASSTAYRGEAKVHHLRGLLALSTATHFTDSSILINEIDSSLEIALGLRPDSELTMAIVNNKLYALACIPEGGHRLLEQGEHLISKMRVVEDLEQWSPEYLDTVGCAYRRLSQLSQSNQQKDGYHALAREYFTRAVDRCNKWHVPTDVKSRIERHRKSL